MKRVLMFVLAMAFLIQACKNDTNINNNNNGGSTNIYNDATLCKIYEQRCSGDPAELIKYFSEQSPAYRKAAVMALGTMRDSNAVVAVASLLSDPEPEVRAAAVFSLGQIGHHLAQKYLMSIDLANQPDEVAASVLVSLGKCGDDKALDFVEKFKAPHSNVALVSAQAKAFCWFGCRGMFSINSSQTCISFVCDTTIHERARAIAAEYFAICNTDFSLYTDEFVSAYRKASLVYNMENIVLGLGKCHNERAFTLLKSILVNDNTDYRVTLNAIVALDNYPYYDCKETILRLLESPDEKIATCAARFLYRNGIQPDTSLYLDLSRNVAGWQTRSVLLATALKFSEYKQNISKGIQSGFNASQNVFEKVALLKALEPDIASFRFVESNSLYSDDELIRTEGLKTLINMYESDRFADFAASHLASSGEKLVDVFADIFKTAIQDGKSQMVQLAARALQRHPEIYARYMNTFFLNQALNALDLPREIDTYMTLVDVIYTVTGQQVEIPELNMREIPDWDFIREVSPEQEIVVKTTKGAITIRTDINNAPVAVSKFLKLVDEEYFDHSLLVNNNILKVENFGSLSGFDETKSVMIPSELTPLEFDEGTMALQSSALNNTCTTQWFVMLTPAALLDGSASVIATVVDGMDIVHAINTGDEIISIKRKK